MIWSDTGLGKRRISGAFLVYILYLFYGYFYLDGIEIVKAEKLLLGDMAFKEC